VGAIFRPKSSTPSIRSFYLCPFHWKLRPSGVSFESARVKSIAQVSENWVIVAQNDYARKAVATTFSVPKWSGAIFRPRSSKPSVRSFYLRPFHWKLRLSGVSLESLGLENIPQVLAHWPKVVKNHDARKAISATLSVLRPRSLTPSVRFFCLCPFYWKLRQSGVSLESPGLENIPKISWNRAKVA